MTTTGDDDESARAQDSSTARGTTAAGSEARLGRRSFLTGAAGVALAATAGCLGRDVADAGRRPLAENPVGEGLADRPRLGTHHSESTVTLVTFDDPHCSYCKQFHEGAFRRIREEWVASGRATAYVRDHSVTGAWGPAALHALEAARRRDETLYWGLKARYFEHQDEVTEATLVERTRSFVADAAADVDADAVAQAAADRPHSDAVAADERASEAALSGDGDATPTTFVFEGGEFRTILGDEDFSAFEAAVESDE